MGAIGWGPGEAPMNPPRRARARRATFLATRRRVHAPRRRGS